MLHRPAIGILGGTFNPPHIGHLILAQDALERLELSQVLFVPCHTPPHKSGAALAPAAHRLAMLEAAVEADPHFSISDIEMRRGGVSYSVDTVREIGREHRGADLHFIIGSDSLLELHLWKDIHTLLELCAFAVFQRPGTDIKTITEKSLRLRTPWPERLLSRVITGHGVDVSSLEIRRRIAEGMSIHYLVPAGVEMYIHEHRLYRR